MVRRPLWEFIQGRPCLDGTHRVSYPKSDLLLVPCHGAFTTASHSRVESKKPTPVENGTVVTMPMKIKQAISVWSTLCLGPSVPICELCLTRA